MTTPRYADHVGRPLTASTELFLEWLEVETGYRPDPESVQLARALVGRFQKSDLNQRRMAEGRKPAKPAPKPAAKKAAPAKAKPAATRRTRKAPAKKGAATAAS